MWRCIINFVVLLLSPSRVNSSSKDKKSRKFLWINPRVLHPSKVLPKRDFSSELVESIRLDGVQQSICLTSVRTIV